MNGREDWILRASRAYGDGDWVVALIASFAAGVVLTLALTGNL
jgi:hypothetical protein